VYVFLSEPFASDKISPWSKILPVGSDVVGYTSFGDFFISSKSHSEFGLILTQSASFERIPVTSLRDFESAFLSDPGVIRSILRPEELKYLAAQLGELDTDEVYFPVPYPCLGGSGELDTYQKGDVWVYASISGQSHNVGAN